MRGQLGEESLRVSVVVIGCGQAGLSAAHHLARRGFSRWQPTSPEPGRPDFLVIDANAGPGGAWLHRWESLQMGYLNGIFDLPGAHLPDFPPSTPSNVAVPAYFAAYEEAENLPILRPVRVLGVEWSESGYTITTDQGSIECSRIINATGTWDNPLLPDIPGMEIFAGVQVHTHDYVRAQDFAGKRVAVVGGGISALEHLDEVSEVASVVWYTRRPPEYTEGDKASSLRQAVARVEENTSVGGAPRSVVSYTGLPSNAPYIVRLRERGLLTPRPMFSQLEEHGVREADGSFTSVDAVIWATGFRPSIAHLAGLELVEPQGGIALHGTRAARDPNIHLIGYGPSQSTVGANRAGREAAVAVARELLGKPAQAE